MRSMTEDSVFVYDRTWDGLLTAVFDAFYRHQFPVAIIGEKGYASSFCGRTSGDNGRGKSRKSVSGIATETFIRCIGLPDDQSFFRTAGFGLTFVSVCMQSREGRAKH